MSRGGGGPQGRGECRPEVRRRRAAAAARSLVLGTPIRLAFDLAGNARELRAMNRRKPGGRCLLSETMAIAVAVARDLSRHSFRRIAGSLAGASGGACTVTHSQNGGGLGSSGSTTWRGACGGGSAWSGRATPASCSALTGTAP